MLDVVVSRAVDPQWIDGVRTALVDGTTVGEINHFVVLAMNNKHWRRDPLHFINAARHTHTGQQLPLARTSADQHVTCDSWVD